VKSKNYQIDPSLLASLYPLSGLHEDELAMLAQSVGALQAKKGTILVSLGDEEEKTLYLLAGRVLLIAGDGHAHILEESATQAKLPISQLIPHRYTVKALSNVEYLKIDSKIVDNLCIEEYTRGGVVDEIEVNDEILQNPLFRDIYDALIADKLVVPTLPRVALRVRKAIEQDADLQEIERIILSDPSIAAMLLKAANSPLYRTYRAARSVEQAIMTMGTKMVKNLVFGYSLRQLFKSKSASINTQMKRLWSHSAHVAAVAFVLARKLKGFEPERALLLGLLHEIGLLVLLRYADRYPHIAESPDMLAVLAQNLHRTIGFLILTQWHFPEDFAVLVKDADDWFREEGQEMDYKDLITIAQLHTCIGKPREDIALFVGDKSLPKLVEVPAFRRLGLDKFSPGQTTSLFTEIQQQLQETWQLLVT
jgi:HD-like signal output (HDOD) protein